MTDAGLEMLKGFEGFRGLPYEDSAGHLTIGYGHRLPLTKGEAEVLLRYKVKPYQTAVEERVTVPLNANQRDALTSFCYNVGVSAFARSTLLRLLNAGQYDAVPVQLKRWTRAGGKPVPGLAKRRAAEAALWSTPDAA